MIGDLLMPCPIGSACKSCPFRRSNWGKPTPDFAKEEDLPWYSLENLTRVWDGIRNGEVLTCHSRDVRMVEGVKNEEVDATCGGAHLLVMREFQVLNRLVEEVSDRTGGPSVITLYLRGGNRRRKLTREGILAVINRAMIGKMPPAEDDEDIGLPEGKLPTPKQIERALARRRGE